jgi:hypothetical protein
MLIGLNSEPLKGMNGRNIEGFSNYPIPALNKMIGRFCRMEIVDIAGIHIRFSDF